MTTGRPEGGPKFVDALNYDILVSMTRMNRPPPPENASKSHRYRDLPPGHWLLQDAKARFSELVRRVHREGPQHVTVHGRDEVVVISAAEFRRLRGERSGEALIAVLQDSPCREIEIEPRRGEMPVREVDL